MLDIIDIADLTNSIKTIAINIPGLLQTGADRENAPRDDGEINTSNVCFPPLLALVGYIESSAQAVVVANQVIIAAVAAAKTEQDPGAPAFFDEATLVFLGVVVTGTPEEEYESGF